MLHLYTASGVEPRVGQLARVLAAPLDDPMAPEWLAAPSQGLGRWLRIELSRTLGASERGGDGVAANLDLAFPGALLQRVLDADRPDGAVDPWALDRLVWVVLDVLDAHHGDDRLGPVGHRAEGVTVFGQARRVADLLDRYGAHRPPMLRAWARGNDVDGGGNDLSPHSRWQPALFRLVRERIGAPSPAERLPDLLRRVAAGDLDLDLPPRLSVFGLTTVPGGPPFLDLLAALSARRDVYLFLVHPSPGLAARFRNQVVPSRVPPGPVGGPHAPGGIDGHPLLRSWARAAGEAVVLWTVAETTGGVRPIRVGPAAADEATTLLQRLQADLRADRPPTADFVPAEQDRSIEVHSCHGPARQVEVLRDAILHRLAGDPTLREDQILVVCPSITTYAPLVEAVFGRSAEVVRPDEPAVGAPRLSYRITDRSLLETYGVPGALSSLVDLIGSRFSASAVLDFLAQQPVRERYGFSDDDLGAIVDATSDTDVRWGLDGDHRTGWLIPDGYAAGSWRAAIERLLLGVATSDDPDALAVGGVAPLGVEGGEIGVVGRLADLLARLARLAEAARHPRPVADWCGPLADAADALLAAPWDARWQQAALHRLLHEVADRSTRHGEPSSVELTLADVRRLLADALGGSPRRPDYFRGGVTVSSLTPLRGVPYRLTCVLGMDDGAFGTAGGDGDDLMAAVAHLGDRDNRSDIRQALLETVLATGEQLLVTCTGHSVVTNQEVPPATPLSELRDAVLAMVHESARDTVRRRLEIVHPRQAFDQRNFVDGALTAGGPWSFDPQACEGARARSGERATVPPFLATPLPGDPTGVIDLADLHSVLRSPVAGFLTRRLDLLLPRDDGPGSDDLPTSLGTLEQWSIAERLLRSRLDGRSGNRWEARERAIGSLPAGVLGDAVIDDIESAVTGLVDAADRAGFRPGQGAARLVDITLDDGTRIVGSVADAQAASPGPVRVSSSKHAPKDRLGAWLDLMALVAHDPSTRWRSLTINRHARKKGAAHVEVLMPAGDGPDDRRSNAIAALAVAVDCYRRALVEPVPLFTKLSSRLAEGKATVNDWRNDFSGFGDGLDAATQMALGDLSYRDLLEIPARPDDPPGDASGRAQRFAGHLWGAIEGSLAPPDDDEGGPA